LQLTGTRRTAALPRDPAISGCSSICGPRGWTHRQAAKRQFIVQQQFRSRPPGDDWRSGGQISTSRFSLPRARLYPQVRTRFSDALTEATAGVQRTISGSEQSIKGCRNPKPRSS